MSNALLNKAGKALFEKHSKHRPANPKYEECIDPRTGKKQKRKREIPPGLSERDAKILKSVQSRAHHLDNGFHPCGMHFGWTFIMGIIPGAGDVADISLNYLLVVRKARKADLPAWLVRKMLVNIAASAVIGLVPFVGDIALAAFKANSRNAWLLEEYLRIRGDQNLKVQAEKKKGNLEQADDPLVPPSDLKQVHPGAGKEPGEVVPGEKPALLSFSKQMSGGGGNGKAKGKAKAQTADTGRFVENVEGSSWKN
ncbi:hypothetical protein C8R47DRAFT_1174310 [Mycena vitilis]|nr:hypothetical protein C8R47DRAFT_1174310 [Mycena vitilis]